MSDILIDQTTTGVMRISLNRPQRRNALTRGLIGELREQVDHATADSSVRLLVLAAEGETFCGGMDLAEMQDRADLPDARELWRDDTKAYRDLLVSLATIPKPTLAVVEGPALAGGMGLAMACDLVLASDAVVFGLPEPKRGITAAVVVPLVVYRAGNSTASYLLFSGQNLAAEESLTRGLCHWVVAPDEVESTERKLCRSILSGAPAALAATKSHLLDTAGQDLLAHLEAGMQVSAQARESEDAREGLTAFLERRSPKWFPQKD